MPMTVRSVPLQTSTTKQQTVYRFSCCIANVGDRKSSSWLRLNASKTRVMWLGSRNRLDKITIHHVLVLIHHVLVLSSSVCIVDTARDLGVVDDIQPTMAAHISSLCRISYFQLRQCRPGCMIAVCRRRQVSGPGICLLSSGLL